MKRVRQLVAQDATHFRVQLREPFDRDPDLPVVKGGDPRRSVGNLCELAVRVERHFHGCLRGKSELLGKLLVLGFEGGGDFPPDELVDGSVVAEQKVGAAQLVEIDVLIVFLQSLLELVQDIGARVELERLLPLPNGKGGPPTTVVDVSQ